MFLVFVKAATNSPTTDFTSIKKKNNTYKYLQYISEGGTFIFRLCLFRTNLLYEICILLHVYSNSLQLQFIYAVLNTLCIDGPIDH